MESSIDSSWRIVRFAGESNPSALDGDVLANRRTFKAHGKSTCVVT